MDDCIYCPDCGGDSIENRDDEDDEIVVCTDCYWEGYPSELVRDDEEE